MNHRPPEMRASLWIVCAVLVAAVGAIVAVRLHDRSAKGGANLGERFEYQIDHYKQIDPSLIRWEQKATFETHAGECRAVAVGPDDRIYVAGETALYVFDRNGAAGRHIPVNSRPHCLCVGGANHAAPGRIYLGLKDHVELLEADGRSAGAWESLGSKAVLTSIALGRNEVFVADAGSQMVYRYDTSGKQLGRIGERDSHSSGGFVVPSPYFDVAVSSEGFLYIVNPGASHRALHAGRQVMVFLGRIVGRDRGLLWMLQPGQYDHAP